MIRHVAIIGTGNVGSAIAFSLAAAGIIEQLSLIDLNKAKAEGEALDLQDGVPFLHPIMIRSGGYDLCRQAQVIIVTAGSNQKPGQSRMDLLQKNAAVYRQVIPALLEYNRNAVLIIVTNPVDPLTYLALKLSNLQPGQVFGSGTVLDTARLRSQISHQCRIDPRNIHGYVLGEHGDGSVVAWSSAQIAGMRLEQYCRFCGKGCSAREEIGDRVKTAAGQIIARKGATYYGVALAVKRSVECVLGDENSVLTVSTLVKGHYGINDVCLSLPAVINSRGVKEVLPPELNPDERQNLLKTAAALKEAQVQIYPSAEFETVPV